MRVSSRMPLFGSVNPTASKSANRPFARPSPRKSPTIDARMPITSASSTTESPHLAPRRAERPQRRELARPLRDRDRQRVDDHERADEERDQAEREQEVAEERDELVGVFASSRAWASPVRTSVFGGRISRICAMSFAGETPGFAATRIWSSLPSLPNSRCAVARSKPASVAPPIELDRAELDEAGDLELLDRALDLHADRLADLQVLLVGRRLVDDDLVRPGPGSLHERQAVELRLRRVDREPEVRRPAERDRLAVLDELRALARDAADRVPDVRQRLHLREAATRRTAPPSIRCRSTSNADFGVIVASVFR